MRPARGGVTWEERAASLAESKRKSRGSAPERSCPVLDGESRSTAAARISTLDVSQQKPILKPNR
jgi:hypothetical protein